MKVTKKGKLKKKEYNRINNFTILLHLKVHACSEMMVVSPNPILTSFPSESLQVELIFVEDSHCCARRTMMNFDAETL